MFSIILVNIVLLGPIFSVQYVKLHLLIGPVTLENAVDVRLLKSTPNLLRKMIPLISLHSFLFERNMSLNPKYNISTSYNIITKQTNLNLVNFSTNERKSMSPLSL